MVRYVIPPIRKTWRGIRNVVYCAIMGKPFKKLCNIENRAVIVNAIAPHMFNILISAYIDVNKSFRDG